MYWSYIGVCCSRKTAKRGSEKGVKTHRRGGVCPVESCEFGDSMRGVVYRWCAQGAMDACDGVVAFAVVVSKDASAVYEGLVEPKEQRGFCESANGVVGGDGETEGRA